MKFYRKSNTERREIKKHAHYQTIPSSMSTEKEIKYKHLLPTHVVGYICIDFVDTLFPNLRKGHED